MMMKQMRLFGRGGLLLLLLLVYSGAQAQSLKDLFSKENIEKAVSAVTQKNTAGMEGSWTYTGSAVQFESDNLLQNAGGALAASALTGKLDDLLEKADIREGEFGFTFQADSSFVASIKNRQLKGTYSYDAEAKKAQLKFARLVGINATVACTSSELQLLFNVSKLLDLLTYLSSKSSNSTLQGISALAENYDGMLLGFAFKREE